MLNNILPTEIIVSLIGLLGIIIGAIPTYFLTRKKGDAEIQKTKAETKKIEAEAEKLRRELELEGSSTKPNSHTIPSTSTEEVNHLKNLLRYIFALHTTEYKLDYWKVTYNIDSKGCTDSSEEMSIRPLSGTVHFKKIILGISPSANRGLVIDPIKVINKKTNQILQTIELNKTSSIAEYAIILDPPATQENFAEIKIETRRDEIFLPLIEKLVDHGKLRIAGSDAGIVELTITAPAELEFTSFSLSPDLGKAEIKEIVNLSVIKWRGKNIPNGIYSYTIQVRKRKH